MEDMVVFDDVSAGDVSSGDFVPALPTVPDMAAGALAGSSPSPDVGETFAGEEPPAGGEMYAGTETAALLQGISAKLDTAVGVDMAFLVVVSLLLGVELIKGFFIGKG